MTPLVLIPGMMCDARLFTPQIAEFSKHRALILACPHQHSTIAEMAEDIAQKAPPRFALCGLSLGGIIAMEMLRQFPKRIERIALLDTNPLAESREAEKRRLAQMHAVRQGRLVEIMRDEMKPNYIAKASAHEDILNLCMRMALDLGPHTFLRQARALIERRDQTATLQAAPTIPALVLCGRNDTLCPLDRHEMMANFLHATLEIIEEAGHLPTLEQPETTNTALARWLEA